MNDLDWKQPALIGGLIAGILAVIPVISAANCCFCAWALVGGAVASKLLINRTPRPVKSGEGARVGLMAGLIAAGIYLLVNLPLTLIKNNENLQREMLDAMAQRSSDPQVQEMMQKFIDIMANLTTGQKLMLFLSVFMGGSVIYIGFTALGGLLGIALFEKRKDQFPPSQYPPTYPPQGSGYGGGGYSGGQGPQYPPNYPPQGGGYGGGNQGGQGGQG